MITKYNILNICDKIRKIISEIDIEIDDFGNNSFWISLEKEEKIMEIDISPQKTIKVAYQDENKKMLPFFYDKEIKATEEDLIKDIENFFNK